MRTLCLFSMIALALMLGCEPSKPKAKAAANSAVAPASPLTAEQKQQFVDHVLAVSRGERPGQDMMNAQALFDKVADTIGVPAGSRAEFISGARQGYEKNSILKLVTTELSQGGGITFLRYSQRDGRETALFRFLKADGNLNYFEFALPSASATNKLESPDLYTYSAAEWLSDASSKIGLMMKAASDQSTLTKMFQGATFGASDAKRFSLMLDKIQAQDSKGVLTAYAALPEKMKQSKICLMLRNAAATTLGDVDEIVATIEDLRKYCPDDPCVAFLSIDLFAARKEFGKAISAVDVLERSVGKDAYLDVFRASLSFQAEDYASAVASAKKAYESDPTLEPAYYLAARAAMAIKDYAAVAAAFKGLQSQGKITPQQIANAAEFADFVATPEFAAWRDAQ